MIKDYKPTAKVQQVRQPKDINQYLADLDALLKRNTGSGTVQGQDTSSNTPMYIPGRVANPTGLSETPSTMAYGNGMTQPQPVQRDQAQQYQEPQSQQNQSFQPTSAQDFLQRFEQAYNAPENRPQAGVPKQEGLASTQDGGTLMQDGTIQYPDGTYRKGDVNAVGVASMRDGGIQYSDGSVRQKMPEGIASLQGQRERILYNDGTARYGAYQYRDGQPQQDLPGGLQGLVKGIFGQDQTITQPFGNYNPRLEPGSGYNMGTDIRTRDLTDRNYKLPVGAEVVQVLRDDGTRFGNISGHQGYGNSVLVRLASGEMLRFSHMSQMADLQPGQRIEAGQAFGVPGTTGNTEGEHLDLEYYNQNGQIDNPENFSGYTNPQGLREPLPGQPAPGTQAPTGREQLASFNPPVASSVNQVQQPQVQQAQQQPMRSPIGELGKSITQAPANAFNTVKEATPELGVTEGLFTPQAAEARKEAVVDAPKPYNPFRQLAGNITERIGDTLGIPEGNFSEAIAGGATKRTNQAFADEINKDRSVAVPGIRQNIQDIGTGIKESAGNALASAGEGVKALGQSGIAALENVFQPKQDIAKRAVGDVAGTAEKPGQAGQYSSLMDTASSMANLQKNDIRDPFFKYGGSEMYKSFLTPNAQSVNGGALSLDTFTPDFYKDLGNIASVFGGSKDLGAATDKYISYERQKYPAASKMGYEDGYDRGAIDDYNRQIDEYNNSLNKYFNEIRSSVSGASSIFNQVAPTVSKNVFANPPQPSASYSPVANSSTAPRFSAAAINKPSASVAAPRPSFSPSNANTSTNRGPVYSPPPQSRPSSNSSSRPAPAPAPRASYNPPKPSFTPSNANTSTNRGAVYTPPPPQSRPSSSQQSKPQNVFSRASSWIKNIFRR